MDLHFDIPHYHVDLLKINYEHYELEVYHKESNEKRVYDIREEIKMINFDDLSLRMNIILSNERYIHLNFESPECIYGDIYEESTEEHLDVFMVHEF